MSQLLRNISSYTGAIVFQKVVSFFYFTFLARMLGPGLAGSYFLGLSLFQIFLAFSDLGMMNYLVRETAQDRASTRDRFAYIYGLRLILVILSYAGLAITTVVLHYSAEVTAVALIAGLALFFDTFTYLHYGVLRGHQLLKSESVGVIVFQGVLVIVGILVIFISKSIVLLSVSLTCASVANYFYSLWALRSFTSFIPRVRFEKRMALHILKQSIPFALIVIFARLYTQTDIIMLSKIGCHTRDCSHTLGLYTVAVKATLVIQSMPLSFMASIYPALSELFIKSREECKQLFQNTLKYLLISICAITMIFILFGNQAVKLVWGDGYAGSVAPLQVLLLGSIFVIGTYPIASLLNSAKFQNQYAFYTLLALVANVILNAVMIPRYGLLGAAWASFCGSFLLFALSGLKMRRTISKPFQGITRFTLGLLISSGAAYILGKQLFGDFQFIIGSVCTATLYLLLLLVTRTLSLDHIKALISSLRGPTTAT